MEIHKSGVQTGILQHYFETPCLSHFLLLSRSCVDWRGNSTGKALVSSPVLPALRHPAGSQGVRTEAVQVPRGNRTTKGTNARMLPKCVRTTTMQVDTQVSAPGADTGLLKPCNFLGGRHICCSNEVTLGAPGWGWSPNEPSHDEKLQIFSHPTTPSSQEGRLEMELINHVYPMKSP